MADKHFQEDFFERESIGKKHEISSLLDRYSRQRFLPYIRIPVEYSVILTISVIVIVIIFYALGVEKGKLSAGKDRPETSGKNMASLDTGKRPAEENNPSEIPFEVVSAEKVLDSGDKIIKALDTIDAEIKNREEKLGFSEKTEKEKDKISSAKTADKTRQAEKVKTVSAEGTKNTADKGTYVIQLVTFKDQASAEKETKKISSKNPNAKWRRSDKWFIVYLDGFSSMEEAKKAKSKMTSVYKDCFVKKVK